MKEYDDITLKKVQQTELGILKDFVELCEKHNLIYFGIAGTAIGAIRHKGFIPWDDDIDVAMPREDFEQFVEIAKREYAQKYCVMNGLENENFPGLCTRWMLNGTKFVDEPFKNVDCPMGIFIDIYPLDKISDDEKKFKKQARKAFLYSKLLILRSIPFPALGFSGIKGKIIHVACALVHYGMAFFHVSKKWLHKKCLNISTQYNNLEGTRRIDFLCDTTAYMNIHELDGLYPLEEYEFEDIKIKLPGNIRENLEREYGDYMQLPPVEKRKNHFPYCLEFKEDK